MSNFGGLWSKVVGRSRPLDAVGEPGSTIPRPLPVARAAQAPPTPNRKETRAGDRFVPRKTAATLTVAGGKKLDARIINMSSLAVAIEADLSKVGVESVVQVGSQPVTFGRNIALGAVFIFVTPIDLRLCNPDIVI